MSGKKKEMIRKLGGEYFDEERRLLDNGYETVVLKTNWLFFACIPACLLAFWAIKRLLNSLDPDDNNSIVFAVMLAAMILGTVLFYVIQYFILIKCMNVPRDKVCLKRKFLRPECYCRQIIPKKDYFIAKAVPLAIFVVIPLAGEFLNPVGWFSCYAAIMLVCFFVEIYYCIQMCIVKDEDCLVGIVPGSAEIRIYHRKKTKQR